MDIESLRIFSAIGSVAAVFLYIYRIVCVIGLMRSESPKVEGNNRLIYAGLIFFVPLGIGAWIYDFVVNGKKASPLFWVPFLIAIYAFVQGMFVIMPHATSFKFDFLTW